MQYSVVQHDTDAANAKRVADSDRKVISEWVNLRKRTAAEKVNSLFKGAPSKLEVMAEAYRSHQAA
jgi:hypothetical protein